MKEIIKYFSDVCGIDIEFFDGISCTSFEREINDLNTYINFGKKYDELVKELEDSQDYSTYLPSGVITRFLVFKNCELLDSFTPAFVKVVQFMLKFVKEHEKVLRDYLDKELIYVTATYSSSHDCHDELENYAFPANYTDEQITEYLNECADSWYESMGYADENEDEDIEDEGADMSWEVTSPNEYKNWTTYTIA